MPKQTNPDTNTKKYIKKTVKPLLMILILFFVATLTLTVLFFTLDKNKDVFLGLSILFGVLTFFLLIALVAEFFTGIRMDDEKIILPGRGKLKYKDIRIVSIRFVHADKPNIPLTVLSVIFLSVLSILFDADFLSGLIGTNKNRYECIFHMDEHADLENYADVKISLEDYGLEQSREIVEILQSKIDHYKII